MVQNHNSTNKEKKKKCERQERSMQGLGGAEMARGAGTNLLTTVSTAGAQRVVFLSRTNPNIQAQCIIIIQHRADCKMCVTCCGAGHYFQ